MLEPFRFLHLADLHLDTVFYGRNEAVRDRLRRALREAFKEAVTTAIEGRAHAVLIAGDAFDSELLTFATECFFINALRRLEEAGIAVIYCTGNYDPGGQLVQRFATPPGITPEREVSPDSYLVWPSNVYLVREAEPVVLPIPQASQEPLARVVSAGFPQKACWDNLAAQFPAMPGDRPTVGLLHTHVQAASRSEEHTPYAPSTRADFEKPGYHYWALGHIHQRQQPFPALPVHYPGNLQGRHFHEPGPKGGNWVEIPPEGPAEVTFVPLASLDWQTVRVTDPDGADPATLAVELASRIPPSKAAQRILRVELVGANPLAEALQDPDNQADLEMDLIERAGALDVEVLPQGLHRPVDREGLLKAPSPLATALELIDRAYSEEGLLDTLTPSTLSALTPTGPEKRRDYLRELLKDTRPELLNRMIRQGQPR